MTLRIGLAGLGTVGGEVARILQDEANLIATKAGKPVTITALAARDRAKKRPFNTQAMPWVNTPEDLAARQDVDAVVELIGGQDGPAKALAEATLKAGKPFITANKALLAHHGNRLAELAEKHRTPIYFEASVAGAIPIIKTLREALAGNSITEVSGILNGTCNYILSTMQETGRAFADVLAEAQSKGYAEADPSFDIDGWDAGHKLVILAALAFGMKADLTALKTEGIRNIAPLDIQFAQELDYRIRLLGMATQSDKGVMLRVSPYLVSTSQSLAHVGGAMNAVYIEGSHAGPITLSGAGAGAGPTASAVLADIIDCAWGQAAPAFGQPYVDLKTPAILGEVDCLSAYYLRLMVTDKSGVLADLAAIMRDSHISIESLIQKGRANNAPVPLVFITHETSEKAMNSALSAFSKMPSILEKPVVIRIMA